MRELNRLLDVLPTTLDALRAQVPREGNSIRRFIDLCVKTQHRADVDLDKFERGPDLQGNAFGGVGLYREAEHLPGLRSLVQEEDNRAQEKANEVGFLHECHNNRYRSCEDYFSCNYWLLREDFIRPLRDAICVVR